MHPRRRHYHSFIISPTRHFITVTKILRKFPSTFVMYDQVRVPQNKIHYFRCSDLEASQPNHRTLGHLMSPEFNQLSKKKINVSFWLCSPQHDSWWYSQTKFCSSHLSNPVIRYTSWMCCCDERVKSHWLGILRKRNMCKAAWRVALISARVIIRRRFDAVLFLLIDNLTSLLC